MRNNNGEIIRRLTNKSLWSNRKGNVFIVVAIMLTTLLLGSVFSIGMSLMESVKMDGIRIMGTAAHAMVGHPTAAQIKKLGSLDYVKAVGTNYTVASVKSTPKMSDISLSLHYFDSTEWGKMRSPAYTDIAGSYPQKENEIMVPAQVLKKAGIDHPSTGMEISLTYDTEGGNSDKTIQKSFRLSGWFTDYTFLTPQASADSILVSKTFSQECGKSVEKDGLADVMFVNPSRTSDYVTKLKQDLHLSGNQIIPVSSYNVDQNTSNAGLIAIIAIIAFIIVTGYLLIYNVLYISVSRDVRFYGLLKTLGTTPKQIRRIVTGQILRLCLVGIPIGEILAFLFSLVLVPSVISKLGSTSTCAVISFSPYIYLGAALFALITALLGAHKPARKAAGISPIEAQKFTGVKYRRSHINSSACRKPYVMAFRNIFRDKKRAVIVLLSLFLGLTTFLAVTTLVGSMSTDNYIASLFESNFVLGNNASLDSPKQEFDSTFLEKIKALPGFQSLSKTTQEYIHLGYSKVEFGKYVSEYVKKSKMPNLTEKDIQDNFNGLLVGVDRNTITKLNQKREKPIDEDAFDRGDFALLATDNPSLFSKTHELAISPVHWNSSKSKTNNSGPNTKISLGGFVPFDFEHIGSGLAPTVFVSNTLMRKVYHDPLITKLNIDVSPAKEQQALNVLKQMTDDNHGIYRSSKLESQARLNGAKMTLYALGDGIALIIALIGILNFVNVMSVGIMVRRHELATLESVGMSRKQVKKLLTYEGLGYAAITLLLVLTFGNLITYGIFTLFRRQATFVVFTYPFLPVLFVSLAVIVICVITPALVYRSICQSPIVERLRESE